MGISLSCLRYYTGNPLASKKKDDHPIYVIKQNGKILRTKAGTRVKEIVTANPDHKVLQVEFGHSATVLPDSFELIESGLYLLVAEGKGLSEESMDTLMKLAQSSKKVGHDKKMDNSNNNGQVVLYKKYPWKPALHTIPEIRSQEN